MFLFNRDSFHKSDDPKPHVKWFYWQTTPNGMNTVKHFCHIDL